MNFGFTLIELMVVLAIIGILATLSAFGLQQARESSRDAQRKSDLQTIRLALEQYRTDCNAYPVESGIFSTLHSSFSTPASCTGTAVNFIAKSPNDPISGRNYYYIGTAFSFTLCASLEGGGTSGDTSACSTAGANCGGAACNYRVTNP